PPAWARVGAGSCSVSFCTPRPEQSADAVPCYRARPIPRGGTRRQGSVHVAGTRRRARGRPGAPLPVAPRRRSSAVPRHPGPAPHRRPCRPRPRRPRPLVGGDGPRTGGGGRRRQRPRRHPRQAARPARGRRRPGRRRLAAHGPGVILGGNEVLAVGRTWPGATVPTGVTATADAVRTALATHDVVHLA